MVGKLGVLCVVAVIAGLAFAVPSNRAIEKVKADIDVIVEDVDSRKKGDWGKAADAILSLSDATTNEVERFLLSKEAAFRYLKSGSGGKAKSVLSAFANDSASVLAIDEEIRRRLSFKEQRQLWNQVKVKVRLKVKPFHAVMSMRHCGSVAILNCNIAGKDQYS